ncbi:MULTISPECIES: DUF6093 family protein [Prauserella salsuginis group]|uniref:Head-to-tail stopper n=2 Tax=Prauserella salsuginis group TaxID=2893672 RepID=A0A839XUJ6_9PSEU|nr:MULTISPECIES: DUF6093 family protein [Prauserella salsuginis group]MBB3666401.1 hypothetical protein [Prauserella sediminis]MCR3719139.1 hypothetical protein [Prauserella flava]MCR3735848.1 hypothetical protein [Prauserella salsuginis]
MSRALRLARRGQRKAESLMADQCTIRPNTGETTDPDTGKLVPTYGPSVYEGRCKIQNQRLRYPSEPVAGEHQWTVAPTEVHIPVRGTADVATGQVVTITSSHDDDNVDREFRIRVGDRKTYGTAIRLIVEEITG